MVDKFTKSGIAACLLLTMASCATMSPEECKLANWQDIGLRDGLEGHSMSRLNNRAKDCQEAGVAVDTRTYLLGRDLGLRNFCLLENAIPLGLNGGTYEGVCPPAVDIQFRQRFQVARAVHDLRNEVQSLYGRIEAQERRLRASHHEEDKRLKAAGNEDERKKIRKAMDDERHDIRIGMNEADRRLRRTRDELRSAETALGSFR